MQPRAAADEEQQLLAAAAAAPIAAASIDGASRYSSFGLSKNPSAAAAQQPQQQQQQKQQKQSRLNKALRTGPAPWSVAAPGRAPGAVAGAREERASERRKSESIVAVVARKIEMEWFHASLLPFSIAPPSPRLPLIRAFPSTKSSLRRTVIADAERMKKQNTKKQQATASQPGMRSTRRRTMSFSPPTRPPPPRPPLPPPPPQQLRPRATLPQTSSSSAGPRPPIPPIMEKTTSQISPWTSSPRSSSRTRSRPRWAASASRRAATSTT